MRQPLPLVGAVAAALVASAFVVLVFRAWRSGAGAWTVFEMTRGRASWSWPSPGQSDDHRLVDAGLRAAGHLEHDPPAVRRLVGDSAPPQPLAVPRVRFGVLVVQRRLVLVHADLVSARAMARTVGLCLPVAADLVIE